VNERKAIAGRRDDSRMAKWMVSKVQPWPVHSFKAFSISSSLTVESSTTL